MAYFTVAFNPNNMEPGGLPPLQEAFNKACYMLNDFANKQGGHLVGTLVFHHPASGKTTIKLMNSAIPPEEENTKSYNVQDDKTT